MKLSTKILLVAFLSACTPILVYLAVNADALRQKSPEAAERYLFRIARDLADTPEARQFVRGFSHSGMESLVRETVDAAGFITRIAVYDEDGQQLSYPVRMEGAPEEDAARLVAAAPIVDGPTTTGRVEVETTATLVASHRRQVIITAVLCGIAGLAVAGVAATMLSKRVSRSLGGMEPDEIATSHASFAAMSNSLHDGVVAIDTHGMISLSNHAARRLLGMKGRDLKDRHIQDIVPETRLPAVVESGEAEYHREQQIHGRVVITNRVPIVENGRIVGAMAIFQDKSQVVQLAEELTGARQLVDTLRAASHEFRNKLHVILGLIERGHVERAKEYITDIQNRRVELSDKLGKTFADPVVSALVLGKCISCGEQGVVLDIADGSRLAPIPDRMLNHALVTIAGNLVDNAMEATRTNPRGDGRILLAIDETDAGITVTVTDNGPGIPGMVAERIFERGFSTKGEGHGMGLYLVSQATESAGGKITLTSAPGRTRFSVSLPK